MSSLINGTVHDFRCCWKQLVLTDIIYKVIAFVVLTPLAGVLFRALIAASGNTVLADQDILFFFLGPVGWLCLITVGAIWLGIVALEQAALMGIICAYAGNQRMGLVEALRFAGANAGPLIRVAARLIAFTLLAVAPFLAIAAGVYVTLLSEYDINYYLTEKPPVFLVAVGIGALLVLAALAVLLRLFTGWFFALPLVLFAGVSPSKALQISRERASGHRPAVLLWIVGWTLATMVLSSLGTAVVVGLGSFLAPRATGSLALLTITIGAILLLWATVSLAVNLLSTTTFAAILFNLYRHLGTDGSIDSSRLNIAETDGHTHFQLTRTRLLTLGVVGVVVAIAIGVVAIHSVHLEDNVEIIAHRGSSKAAPENTMAAVKQAIEDGADWVEIDVQETADGHVVLFHDSDFMKLAGVDLKIWDATMTDLKDIDIGSWFDAAFESERVPTLGEVLDGCKGKVGVNIELKYYGHDKKVEQRVVDIVEAHDMTANVVIMSLKIDAVKKMKSIRPRWKVGLLMSVAAGDLKKIETNFLAVNATFADRSFIQSAHASGKDVYVWTVNDAVTMSTMIGRGVDGLITDKPALARSVLQQRAQMSAPERLLVELAGVFGVVRQIGEQ